MKTFKLAIWIHTPLQRPLKDGSDPPQCFLVCPCVLFYQVHRTYFSRKKSIHSSRGSAHQTPFVETTTKETTPISDHNYWSKVGNLKQKNKTHTSHLDGRWGQFGRATTKQNNGAVLLSSRRIKKKKKPKVSRKWHLFWFLKTRNCFRKFRPSEKKKTAGAVIIFHRTLDRFTPVQKVGGRGETNCVEKERNWPPLFFLQGPRPLRNHARFLTRHGENKRNALPFFLLFIIIFGSAWLPTLINIDLMSPPVVVVCGRETEKCLSKIAAIFSPELGQRSSQGDLTIARWVPERSGCQPRFTWVLWKRHLVGERRWDDFWPPPMFFSPSTFSDIFIYLLIFFPGLLTILNDASRSQERFISLSSFFFLFYVEICWQLKLL